MTPDGFESADIRVYMYVCLFILARRVANADNRAGYSLYRRLNDDGHWIGFIKQHVSTNNIDTKEYQHNQLVTHSLAKVCRRK